MLSQTPHQQPPQKHNCLGHSTTGVREKQVVTPRRTRVRIASSASLTRLTGTRTPLISRKPTECNFQRAANTEGNAPLPLRPRASSRSRASHDRQSRFPTKRESGRWQRTQTCRAAATTAACRSTTTFRPTCTAPCSQPRQYQSDRQDSVPRCSTRKKSAAHDCADKSKLRRSQ